MSGLRAVGELVFEFPTFCTVGRFSPIAISTLQKVRKPNSAIEAFIERHGDGDVGETVEHEGGLLKRLPESLHSRDSSAFGPIAIRYYGYASRPTQKVALQSLAASLRKIFGKMC